MAEGSFENLGPRWYVAHTYTGYENKVMANLEKIIENRSLHHLIFDIKVPVETVIENVNGQEKEVEYKTFPSYVFVKMIMNDEVWHIVRYISGVTGFVGPGSRPVPLSDEEARAISGEELVKADAFSIGDMVEIVDGILTGHSGRISEISADTQEVTVIVTSIGRDMPVSLDAKCIKKIEE